jgi:hypothetical protein
MILARGGEEAFLFLANDTSSKLIKESEASVTEAMGLAGSGKGI